MRKPALLLALAGVSLLMTSDAFGQCQRGGGSRSASMSPASSNLVRAGTPYAMSSFSGGNDSPIVQAYQQQMMQQQAYVQQVLLQRAYAKQQRAQKASEGRQRLVAEAKARDARRLHPASEYGTPLFASNGK